MTADRTCRRLSRVVILVLTAAGTVLASSASAAAADDFGQHAADCARDMGFDGGHNPGMHLGYAGWDPTHDC